MFQSCGNMFKCGLFGGFLMLKLFSLLLASMVFLSGCTASGGYARCGNAVCYQSGEDDDSLSDEDREFQSRFVNDRDFESKFPDDNKFESRFDDDEAFEERHRLAQEKAEAKNAEDSDSNED